MALHALFHRDDGARDIPGTDTPWDGWVSATKTRNWINDDPILDWLSLFGEANGFLPDDKQPGYDSRTDFGRFVMAKGIEFEKAAIRYLADRHSVITVANDRSSPRSEAAVRQTWDAMAAGSEIIAQAPIWNPQAHTYGVIDLLVRSDVLASLFPSEMSGAEAAVPAPDLPRASWHYRVIDIKFTGLDLLANGHAASSHLHYAVQVAIYNAALGRLQGFTPSSAYLLGRGWEQQKQRGRSAMERLCRVDQAHVRRSGESLVDLARDGCEWIRRVRSHGAGWTVLPAPSVAELWPNMRNSEDEPWRAAKKRIATELEDLTLLPRITPALRRDAHSSGIVRWKDPACSAARLGVTTPAYSALLDAVIAANHSDADDPVLFPARVTANEPMWRLAAPVEFFVDFETTNDVSDDFGTFPVRGGQPLILMVGCGYHEADGRWNFRVFTTDRLDEADEARVLGAWIEFMRSACAAVDRELADARIFHWSPAEVSTLQNAYNSAAARHGLPAWNNLPWVDLWTNLAKAQPIGVRGAFGYGLKAITKAMNAHGLIDTTWGDGPTDGLGAMVGAWWCDAEARRLSISMRELDLMRQIEDYNRVDVEAMRDVLSWLRKNR